MTAYDVYVFLLFLFVFTLLTLVLSTMLVMLVRSYIKLVNCGAEDEAILTEYKHAARRKKRKSARVLGCICTVFITGATIAAFCVFAVSLFIGARSASMVGLVPSLKVVKSSSMAVKNPDNRYLFDNQLDDQVQTFDLIVLRKLPAEAALRQYDIVAYERDGEMILHRIVNIEEPNSEHPDQRYFLLQGDAIQYHDRFPVLYEDMRGIYKGERIPFVGSFVAFMQSPAGWLCILLIVFAIIATPITERRIAAIKRDRYDLISSASCGKQNEKAAAPVLSTKRGD